MDPYKNFAVSTVATAPSPATTGTSLAVEAGNGTYFSEGANAVVCPAGEQPTWSNAEIVRITAISTDTFTITREQESTSARTIAVGDVIFQGITDTWLDDLLNGQFIVDATGKTTPVDADTLPLIDSADSSNLKKLTWPNLKATLKSYFDSVATTLTNKTLTNPTITFSDNAPDYNVLCKVYRRGSNQSIPNNTETKVQLNAEIFDLGGDFDSTTNYRFTAPVTGYYRIDTMVSWPSAVANAEYQHLLYINGGTYSELKYTGYPAAAGIYSQTSSTIFQLDSSDYLELFVKQQSGGADDLYQYEAFTSMTIMLVST
jgi:hypothetical protein